MNQYLLSILKEFNTIIIPGIGALTITNAKTGDIMFMPYLKHDDGKLAEYIANHDGIDKTEAQNIIAKHVREIENMLNKGDEYSMYELGTFVKENDEIVFIPWGKDVSQKKVDESTPPVEKVTESNDVDPSKKETTDQKVKINESLKDKKVDAVQPKAKSVVTPIREPSKDVAEKVNLVEENSFTPKKELNILEKEEKKETQDKLDKLKTKKEEKKPKKKLNASKLVLVILLAFIGVGGIYFGMNYNELKQHVPFLADKETHSDKESDSEENNSAQEADNEIDNEVDSEYDDSLSEDTTEENNEETEFEKEVDNTEQGIEETPLVEEAFTAPESSSKYSLIAGSFEEKQNALDLSQSLQQKGYEGAINETDGVYRVTIKSFSTINDAVNYRETVATEFPSAWVKRN